MKKRPIQVAPQIQKIVPSSALQTLVRLAPFMNDCPAGLAFTTMYCFLTPYGGVDPGEPFDVIFHVLPTIRRRILE